LPSGCRPALGKPATWPSRYGVMVFAERKRSYIKRNLLHAFAKTHATATHRQLAHTAERYVQLFPI